MNSIEALDYALARLERIKISPARPDALERAIELQQAIETLTALRKQIADQQLDAGIGAI
jgi:hypothetical protein